jgi:hypothetical protein
MFLSLFPQKAKGRDRCLASSAPAPPPHAGARGDIIKTCSLGNYEVKIMALTIFNKYDLEMCIC